MPASPQPLTPSGLVVQCVGLKPNFERHEVVGARQRVIHKGAGEHLPGCPGR